jgi:outer membrane murein-binding lipoprotein Lpp
MGGESAGIVPITADARYVVAMPETPASGPEPTIADAVAVFQAGFAQMMSALGVTNAKVGEISDKVDALSAKVDHVQADVAQVRADVLAVKVEHGFYERHQMSLQTALGQHMQDPDGHSHAA